MTSRSNASAGNSAGPLAKLGLISTTASLVLLTGLAGITVASAAPSDKQQVQQVIENYLQKYRKDEGISAISVYVTRSKDDKGFAAVTGTTMRGGKGVPITPETRFQIGSNSKAFTSVLLQLWETRNQITLDQRLGLWLPQYSAWKDNTIREMLHMVSAIPTYSEAPKMQKSMATDMFRHYTPSELIAYAYPSGGNHLPVPTGYFYSNTNYILGGMIAEKIGNQSRPNRGFSYEQQLRDWIFKPLGMTETSYSSWAVPNSVIKKMSSGYFENPACGEYQPNCKVSGLAPLLGKNMLHADLTWAGAAGGIISTPRDLQKWVRGLFQGGLLPAKQLSEMKELVSMDTGKPLPFTTAKEPRGFGLGVGQMFIPGVGRLWFYEGVTLGYRTVFAYYPQNDVVITLSLNSQPENDHIGELLTNLQNVLLK